MLSSEFPLAIVIPIWAIQIFYNTKSVSGIEYRVSGKIYRDKFKNSILYLTGAMPSLIFIGLYNYHFTGNPLKMIYTYEMTNNLGFSTPSFNALWKLLFSMYSGLFFYMPFLIFVLYYMIVNFKKKYISLLFSNYLILIVIINILLISSFGSWRGGWTYGPRYLTAIAVLLGYEGISRISGWEKMKHSLSKALIRAYL